jgi:hypothetical protein
VLATKARTATFCDLVRKMFVCNNIQPDLLPPAKFAALALIVDPDEEPSQSPLLLRDRFSAILGALRRLHPLAVRAPAQSRRLMDVSHLATQTQGADFWTLRQLQSREVADEHKREFDVTHKVLRSWEEKVRSALIHVEQQTAFLSRAGALRGLVDHLVQQHLLEAASARNRVYLDERRRAVRHGGKGGAAAAKAPIARPRDLCPPPPPPPRLAPRTNASPSRRKPGAARPPREPTKSVSRLAAFRIKSRLRPTALAVGPRPRALCPPAQAVERRACPTGGSGGVHLGSTTMHLAVSRPIFFGTRPPHVFGPGPLCAPLCPPAPPSPSQPPLCRWLDFGTGRAFPPPPPPGPDEIGDEDRGEASHGPPVAVSPRGRLRACRSYWMATMRQIGFVCALTLSVINSGFLP